MKRAAAATGASARGSYLTRVADMRRARRRAKWAPLVYPESDPDYFMYPNECLGDESVLNWGLGKYAITPLGQAFQNLHLRGLVNYARGSLDANKAIVVPSSKQDAPMLLVEGAAQDEVSPGIKQISRSAFEHLKRHVTAELSHGDAVFVHDGTVGGNAGSWATVRSFCGSGNTALMLHHMMSSVRLPIELFADDHPDYPAWKASLPEELQEDEEELLAALDHGKIDPPPTYGPVHGLTQYLVPELHLEDAKALGLPGNNFSVLDYHDGVAIHAGSANSIASVRSVLSALASSQLERLGAMLLPARIEGDTLVFHGEQGGAETVWGADNKVSSAWQSDVLPAGSTTTQFGDYVEGDSLLSSRELPVVGAPTPKEISFVGGKKGSDLKSRVSQRGVKDTVAELFAARVKELKIKH